MAKLLCWPNNYNGNYTALGKQQHHNGKATELAKEQHINLKSKLLHGPK